jgi:subtilisin-like proprotein convertase family protein
MGNWRLNIKYLRQNHKITFAMAIIKRFCAKDTAFCTDDNLLIGRGE